jgi:hypothetical protein
MSRERRTELLVAMLVATLTTIAVVWARNSGSPIGATFLAGLGSGSLATYIAMANATIARAKQRV